MTTKRKFYLNTVTIQVLTEDSPLEADDLKDVAYEIDQGDSVGGSMEIRSKAIGPKATATKLYRFGSDPGFFQLDDNGKSIED